jgi:hypothetical protein
VTVSRARHADARRNVEVALAFCRPHLASFGVAEAMACVWVSANAMVTRVGCRGEGEGGHRAPQGGADNWTSTVMSEQCGVSSIGFIPQVRCFEKTLVANRQASHKMQCLPSVHV